MFASLNNCIHNFTMKTRTHFDMLTTIFVAVLLVSNIASSAKIIDWGISIFGIPLAFDAGTLLFPISYIFGDILTEVYGYVRAKRVIWTGFACAISMSAYFWLVQYMPGEALWQEYAGDAAYAGILGGVSNGGIVLASALAYIFGEFSNSYVLAKLKIWTQGKMLWLRTIGSTIVGQALDTSIFVVVACLAGVFPWEIAGSLIVANYIFKVSIEVLFTPLTYTIIHYIKRTEGVDCYDTQTNFNPLSF